MNVESEAEAFLRSRRRATVGDDFQASPAMPDDESSANGERPSGSMMPAPELSPIALTGPIGEIVRALEPNTEAHPAGILFSLLTMFGIAVGRGPWQELDSSRHGTNLFTIIVGLSSDGRKGTAVARGRQVLTELDPVFATTNVAGGLTTGEGVIYRVRDATAAGADGNCSDSGVTDKRLLILSDEFGAALRKMQGRENILGYVLREAWDSSNLRTLTRRDPLTATNPHIGLIGQIVPDELRRQTSETDFLGGTISRCLFCYVERTKMLPEPLEPDPRLPVLIQTLRENLERARAVKLLVISDSARAWWRSEYEGLSTGSPGRLGQATRRGGPYVRRLAAIYALAEGSGVIMLPHFEAAFAAWSFSVASAAFIFGRFNFSPLAERLLSALDLAGASGLSRSEIRDKVVRSGAVEAKRIESALLELRDAGSARMRAVPTSGRSRETWYSTSQLLAHPGAKGAKGA